MDHRLALRVFLARTIDPFACVNLGEDRYVRRDGASA